MSSTSDRGRPSAGRLGKDTSPARLLPITLSSIWAFSLAFSASTRELGTRAKAALKSCLYRKERGRPSDTAHTPRAPTRVLEAIKQVKGLARR
jgi:hypothetical protein